MHVNEAYQQWLEAPTDENKDVLGASLLHYVQRLIKRRFGILFYSTYEEAIGESLIKIYEKLPNLRIANSFSGWVGAIVQNTCYDISKSRRIGPSQKETALIENVHVKQDPNGVAKRFLNQLTVDLTDDEQSLLQDKLTGFSDEEIAAKLGVSLSAMKMRFNRIKGKMKKKAIIL